MKFKETLIIFFQKLRPVNLVILLIKVYKLCISPYLGNNCRFYPSCSSYALDAYKSKNFFTATYLTVWRILRCNPFSKGGYDPLK